MTNPKPVSQNSQRIDTSGLGNIFDVAVSGDSAATTSKTVVELSIPEAAKRLNTSERTVWRRIQRGELKSKTKGNKRLVKLPIIELEASVDSEGHTSVSDIVPPSSALVDIHGIIRDLQAANYRIGYLQSKVDSDQVELLQLPDLQARAKAAEQLERDAELQRNQIHALETELKSLKSKWFYRLAAWLSGS
ncbi:MAG: helix-turn-helix domain-containing protein [Cyanobacteria bacterium SZAS LIN-5]|nr:helix-turn-helix domain-containing protein [Cyanobacteria bacterium SZAS LIN-5]